ncbi:hypothetical protein [Clostridium niameyense]|nr:hypothetical protein [Clostridium niameyense]
MNSLCNIKIIWKAEICKNSFNDLKKPALSLEKCIESYYITVYNCM